MGKLLPFPLIKIIFVEMTVLRTYICTAQLGEFYDKPVSTSEVYLIYIYKAFSNIEIECNVLENSVLVK